MANVIYEVMAPDGQTVLEIEGPEGASEAQVMAAAQQLYREQLQTQAAATDVPVLDERGRVVQPPAAAPRPEPTMGERAVGLGETLLTMGSALPSMAAQAGGALGASAAAILRGEFGTPQAAQMIQETAMEQAQRPLIMPKTAAGQQMVQAVGRAAEAIPPFVPMAAELGMAGRLAGAAGRQAVTAGREAAGRAAVATAEEARAIGRDVAEVGRGVREIGEMGRRVITEPTPQGRAAGAAETPAAMQRRATAEALPVPFEGPSKLTTGQATRDFNQLKFEKEMAKYEQGQPLRERVENQTQTLLGNFDAMVDRLEPINVEPRELGMGVDKALVNRAEVKRRQIRQAYEKARATGDMEAPVSMDALAQRAADLTRYEGVSPNIRAIRNEARRLGAIIEDENGNILPGTVSINNSEILRQFVNESTDWTNPREALFAKRFTSAIDDATEGAGGEAYKQARRLRRQFADEFENASLTARLLSTKPGSDDRRVAYEDVFDKIIVASPLEEMNKTRSTLLRSGADGKRAWQDLKAYGLEYIKNKSLSPSQTDSRGNPLVSPDKLQRTIQAMDRRGKLESLYGKKQAQTLRDLADIASVIYTAPPGAINTSNTASALQVALDSVATFGLTGIPAPAMTALREASKYVKDRKTRARINAALEGK